MSSAIVKQLATATLTEIANQTGVPSARELVKSTFSKATGNAVKPDKKERAKKELLDIKNSIANIDKKIQQ